jgi:hypothetical protein
MASTAELELATLEKDLSTFARRTVRRASAETLTQLAAKTRDIAKANVTQRFTLRGTGKRYTLGGIRSTKQSPFQPLARQHTRVGAANKPRSKDNYLGLQETGGTLPPTKGGKRRLTTAQGSREGDRATPRKRLARGRLRPGRMQVERKLRGKGLTREQRQIATVLRARRRGKRLVYMKLPDSQNEGIFELRGSRKNPQLKQVHRIYRKRLRVKARPWLEPAYKQATKGAEALGVRVMGEALRRDGLFRG